MTALTRGRRWAVDPSQGVDQRGSHRPAEHVRSDGRATGRRTTLRKVGPRLDPESVNARVDDVTGATYGQFHTIVDISGKDHVVNTQLRLAGGRVDDSRHFRDVLGNVPTAVVAITALDADGRPTGMTVGSFASVSLDPPLVSFMPGKSSTTMPKIQASGRFCANILAAGQEEVCRQLARSGGEKFSNLRWELSEHGTPHISGANAWIDCTITATHDAGDHDIVVGSVDSLSVVHTESPLIFLRGGYGRFASSSLSAPAEADLYTPLRTIGLATMAMQALSTELDVECLASVVIGEQLVLIGSSQSGRNEAPSHQRLGQRMPFRPPLAIPLIAWQPESAIDRWLDRAPTALDSEQLRLMVARVRDRGWSIVLRSPEQHRFERAVADLPIVGGSSEQIDELRQAAEELRLDTYEPEVIEPNSTYSVQLMTAPVFDATGDVRLALSLYHLPPLMTGAEIARFGDRLTALAKEVSTGPENHV